VKTVLWQLQVSGGKKKKKKTHSFSTQATIKERELDGSLAH